MNKIPLLLSKSLQPCQAGEGAGVATRIVPRRQDKVPCAGAGGRGVGVGMAVGLGRFKEGLCGLQASGVCGQLEWTEPLSLPGAEGVAGEVLSEVEEGAAGHRWAGALGNQRNSTNTRQQGPAEKAGQRGRGRGVARADAVQSREVGGRSQGADRPLPGRPTTATRWRPVGAPAAATNGTAQNSGSGCPPTPGGPWPSQADTRSPCPLRRPWLRPHPSTSAPVCGVSLSLRSPSPVSYKDSDHFVF